MTKKEALAEAQKRWGNNAMVRVHSFTVTYTYYQVRSESRSGIDVVVGNSGHANHVGSWEEAFANADERDLV